MRVFFDASAFAKRYVREEGTDEVLGWCNRADEIALSVIAIPEIVSALCRLKRSAHLAEGQYKQCKANFLGDIADALIYDTSPQVIQLAGRHWSNMHYEAWTRFTSAPRLLVKPMPSSRQTFANVTGRCNGNGITHRLSTEPPRGYRLPDRL